MISYCNGVQGFINYALSNSRKVSSSRCYNETSFQKRLMEKLLCWYAHGEPYVPHNTMIEMMVRSTSSSSNVHGVVDDNSNPYKNMVMNAMRMNHGHASQCPFIDEEPNADVNIFF